MSERKGSGEGVGGDRSRKNADPACGLLGWWLAGASRR